MPGGNPALGGANMPSMQGPAANVPQLYQMLAQWQGGGGMPGITPDANSLSDVYMHMPRGAGPNDPASLQRGMPPGPGASPMGRPPVQQRPPMQAPGGGAMPGMGTMPAGPAGSIPPQMLAALAARGRSPGFAHGAPAGYAGMDAGAGARAFGRGGGGSSSLLDALGMGGNIGGDPTRRRA